MNRFLSRFRRDARGVSAVEFALIAPIIIVFYFGLAELCQGYMALKRTEHIASAIADLVAQQDEISVAELNDVFTVSTHIMAPYPTGTLRQRVSTVAVNSSGIARVTWSSQKNWSARAANQVVTLPPNIVSNGDSVVMSEVEYAYASPVTYFMPSQTTFRKTYYLRPRAAATVTRVN